MKDEKYLIKIIFRDKKGNLEKFSFVVNSLEGCFYELANKKNQIVSYHVYDLNDEFNDDFERGV